MAIIRDYIDGQFKDDESQSVGIGGFTTAAIIKEDVKRTRDVPTTFLEDGTHINDHIIRNPLTLSIEGVISDVYINPSPVLAAIRAFETQVGAVAQYLPARTQSQISLIDGIVPDMQNRIDALDQAAQTGQNIAEYAGFTGSEGKSNIESFVDTMEGILNSDVLINIDAPFRKYENMSITSLSYTRDSTTKSMSFNIEAQQLRFAQTLFAQVSSASSPASGLDGQTSGEVDKGSQEGVEAPQSFISSLSERFGGLF